MNFTLSNSLITSLGDVIVSSSNAFGEPSTFIDPLAQDSACARDLPFLQALGVNVLRVYSVNSSLNHDACMNAFSAAGIYTMWVRNSNSTYVTDFQPLALTSPFLWTARLTELPLPGGRTYWTNTLKQLVPSANTIMSSLITLEMKLSSRTILKSLLTSKQPQETQRRTCKPPNIFVMSSQLIWDTGPL